MLQDLIIHNYKELSDQTLQLHELASVNYFVGENSSGKTTVLRYIFEQHFDTSVWITDAITDLDHLQTLDIKKSLSPLPRQPWKQLYVDSVDTYHFVSLDLLAFSTHISKSGVNWGVINPVIYVQSIDLLRSLGIISAGFAHTKHGHIAHTEGVETINAGAHKLVNLIYSIISAHTVHKAEYIMIDNPGDRLHPSWQKKIPLILHALTKLYPIQCFVATHSPFVISSIGGLASQSSIRDKVYFIVSGAIANRKGVPSHKGRYGYWGEKVAEISAKMLGAGLLDLLSAQQQPSLQPDSPILVLCEGEGENADGKLYSLIFKDREPFSWFISCRGSSQLLKTFTILNQIKPALSADFSLFMVRDRDHEFPQDEDIRDFESSLLSSRVLKRRAIECYLLQPSTAELVLSRFDKKLLAKDLAEYNRLYSIIDRGTKHGDPGDEYKEQLYNWFMTATRGYTSSLFIDTGYTVMEKVARLIYPGHDAYDQLEQDIFGSRR